MRTIAITGASSGIGAAAAETLVRQGYRVVPIGRSAERLQAVTRRMRRVVRDGGEVLQPRLADFAHLDEVADLAADLEREHVEVLVNNAAIQPYRRSVTPAGLESTLVVNHLAPKLLIDRLIEGIHERGGAVISTGSSSHLQANAVLDDIQLEKGWTWERAYGRSKLFTLMMTEALRRRGYAATSFHPGDIRTAINRDAPFVRILKPLEYLKYKAPSIGADTLVWLCSDGFDEITRARYFVERSPAPHNLPDDAAIDALERATQLLLEAHVSH